MLEVSDPVTAPALNAQQFGHTDAAAPTPDAAAPTPTAPQSGADEPLAASPAAERTEPPPAAQADAES